MNCDATPDIRVFPDAPALARALAEELRQVLADRAPSGGPFSLVLSGGSTPQALFRELARAEVRESIDWRGVHLFWGDERCVPPGHADSNYRSAWETLLKFLPMPAGNRHRIRGEDDPAREAARYGRELDGWLAQPPRESFFDWVFLGMGTDGHTASLFPGGGLETDATGWCGVATHPESGQKRISLTLKALERARRVTFLVTGRDKADRVYEILEAREANLPAARVRAERVEWCLDAAAAGRLRRE